MTNLELIKAHQASLGYLSSNLPEMGTKKLAEDEMVMYWEPTTPQGLTHLRMIANKLGRKINEGDTVDIRLYYLRA